MRKKIDIHTHATLQDPGMDKYLAVMDKHGVEAALVHGSMIEGRQNEEVLCAVKAHPNRLYGSVYVDLLKPVPECIELVKRHADEGFKSVKLFPNFGYDANDEKYEPFWQVVEDMNLMCLIHCGWLGHSKERAHLHIQSLTATPFHFEVPARRHEGINFIFAHFGGGASYLETVTLLSRLPNCHADTCPGWGWWVWAHRMPGLEGLDFSHVLYGTDNAGDGYERDEHWWTMHLTSMGRTKDDLDLYFYGNAARLLGIDSE